MKTAYFDCFSGISGDMLTGALLDAGLDFGSLKDELAKLGLSGYSVSKEKAIRGGISGTKFNVNVKDEKTSRNPADILEIIKKSGLDEDIKEKSSEIFSAISLVEAKIHGLPAEEIHLHELGGIDCIIDVVSALAGLKLLGIEKVFSSAVNTGSGFVDSSHGKLPVPSPAAVELLKGVPVYSSGVSAELATPTGAAIIKSVSSSFGNMPGMKIRESGYGAGDRELPCPNLLRVVIGESDEEYKDETVLSVETNIDNMNPEFYEHVFKKLLAGGALDVSLTPLFMKKQRPGVKLSVICGEKDLDRISGLIFRETTSIGLRYGRLRRKTLSRETRELKTEYGPIRVKFAFSGDKTVNCSPEYDDCVLLAEKKNVPVKLVFDAAKRGAEEWLRR